MTVGMVTYRTHDEKSCVSCVHRYDELFPGEYVDCPFTFYPLKKPISGCRFYKYGNPKPHDDIELNDGDLYVTYIDNVPEKHMWVLPYGGIESCPDWYLLHLKDIWDTNNEHIHQT